MNFLVKLYPWEDPRVSVSEVNLNDGDRVVVATDFFNEIGVVVGKCKRSEDSKDRVVRVVTKKDLESFSKFEEERDSLVDICKSEIKTLGLGMKVIDARTSLDGKQTIFVFTADGRVDFRELVRNLSGKFKRVIRMQQIGSRDEARKLGGYGICGRKLCCVNLEGNIPSITTDMARAQQIAHRGAERISGLCGRLMCCLAYEAEQYKEMLVGMPELYSVIKTPEGKGTVIELNVMNQEVKAKLETGKYITIKKKDIK
ncbi:MAG: hypothetical protein HGB08_03710 [Candidatus Moranbacteria bacterium]|nr:hypothetical protein [Candidatus Moranbacteria bacterium]